MNAAALDQLLAAWDERLRRADENLLALEAEPTYQMLAGPDGAKVTLEGATRLRVVPALEALAELFEQRARLTEVLDRAREVRRGFSAIWANDEKIAEVSRLLHGPSIKLGARPTPLAERNLLDPAAVDVAVVPEELLAAMAQAFDRARDAVLAVAGAWARLTPALERAEEQVAELRVKATALGEASPIDGELLTIERELALLRTRVARDPLGVVGIVDGALGPGIAAARARIDGLLTSRAKVTQMLTKGGELRRAIDEARIEAARARDRVARDYAHADVGEHVEASLVEGLDVWRARIEGTARAGRWSSAEVGLARWLETAESYLAAERAIAAGAAALSARQAELAGRLSARRAQLEAIVRRGVNVDPALKDLAHAAEETLRRRPLNLEVATISVEAFEERVLAAQRLLRGVTP